MKKEEAINYFGSQVNLAKAIGVSPQAIQVWGNSIPIARQFQIQVVTNGDLIADPVKPKTKQYAAEQ